MVRLALAPDSDISHESYSPFRDDRGEGWLAKEDRMVEQFTAEQVVPEPPVDEWVRRLRDRDEQYEALEELRTVLMRAVSHAFRTAKGGHSFHEDVVQDSLIRILDKLDTFSGRSQFTTWAISVAVRIGTSQLRRKRFKDVSLDALSSGENMKFEVADDGTDAVDVIEERQTIIQTLRDLIETTLTERQRQATDALLHGMPVEEIASRTGSNRNAVYKLVHDARMKLKQGLEKAGFSADDIQQVF